MAEMDYTKLTIEELEEEAHRIGATTLEIKELEKCFRF
jgi:hypothetical protein